MKLILWLILALGVGFWLLIIAVAVSLNSVVGTVVVLASALGLIRFYLDLRQ